MDEYHNHDYVCYQTLRIENFERQIRPSLLLHHYISLNFSFEFKFYLWLQNQDSESPDFIREQVSLGDTDIAVPVRVTESSYDELIRGGLETLRPHLPLSGDNRQQLIEFALEKVRETVGHRVSCRCKSSMNLNFTLVVEHNHVFDSLQEISQVCMVPASDSAVKSLKKYEIDSGNTEESSCSICLEDFSSDVEGREALCMPCDHVFHGDCIEKWLRTSHYCPLCRYEMPTS